MSRISAMDALRPKKTTGKTFLAGSHPRKAPRKTKKGGAAKGSGNWDRFRLVRRRGISIVELSDRSLIKEEELTELAGDLLALVEAGHHRIVLNFVAVERLSTWAVGFISESLRRCARASEGSLKVCGLRADLAAIFEVAGLARDFPLFADENEAIDSPWPIRSELQPLPIEILSALTLKANLPSEEVLENTDMAAGR